MVECAFGEVNVSSDAGLLLAKVAEEKFGIIARLAACFTDHRSPRLVEHKLSELVKQRCFGLICGYQDLNDHDTLGKDPLLATAIGKTDLTGEKRSHPRDIGRPCAGKSTLSRLDCTTNGKYTFDPEAAQSGLLDAFFAQTTTAPAELVLDFDASCSRLHGNQEFRHFLAQYDAYCYLPLFVFCGDHLLAAKLHTADIDAGHAAAPTVARLITALRTRWPGIRILIRADSGYCREELLALCEASNVDFVIGLPKNAVLNKMISAELALAEAASTASGEAARVFAELRYKTHTTWSRERRVVAKAEHLAATEQHVTQRSNPRYVVTSLAIDEVDAQDLYEEVYSARGDAENRIKEVQLGLFSERLSSSTHAANERRFLYAVYGYVLYTSIRRHVLQNTPAETLQSWTFRALFLKVGAVIRVSVRRVLVTLSAAFPRRQAFRLLIERLTALPRLVL